MFACGDDATPSANDETGSSTAASTDQASTGGETGASAASTGTAGHASGTAADTGSADATTAGGTTAADDTTAGGTSGSESDGSGSGSSTGQAVVGDPFVMFTDVAYDAGLDSVHGTLQSIPDCLIDQAGPGVGGFCISERMSGASAVGDVDDDGWPDLYYSRTYGYDRLYRNQGDGTFVDIAAESGILSGTGSSGSVLADFDNDGDQDLYVTRIGALRYDLYINDDGTFSEQAIARGASLKSEIQHSPTGVAVGDYDRDGYLDLYVAEWKTNAGISKEASHSRLLHNLGDAAPGYFEDVTEAAGVNIDNVWKDVDTPAGTYAFSPSLADMDGDGWPDLAIVSDFRCTRLFWNNGDGTFEDGTVASGAGVDRNGMGSTLGDYDSDGDLDWFITSITTPNGEPENRFLRNLGDRQFADLAGALGVDAGGWGWGTTFLDVDNDRDLDLMMTAGYYYTSYLEDKNQLWLGHGNGTFTVDVATEVGLSSDTDAQGRGLNTMDYDRDGDVDVVLINNNGFPNLFRNDGEDLGDWLTVRAVGTTSNRDGFGAKVTVVTEPGMPILHREVGSMSHYVGHSGREVHFGLGWGDDPITEVRVHFPASGVTKVLSDVERNQRIVVTE